LSTDLAYQFRDDFLWGAATAAHHVEGNNDNCDWWEWEQLPGKIKDGSVSGSACEHYTRYRDDFQMLKDMGHNAHRISIEWSRIERSPGKIDGGAVAHYRDVLETLHSMGITPLVSLHHFTSPIWFAHAGGFEDDDSVDIFRRWTRFCANEYGDLVQTWTTFNEPNVYAYQGYLVGEWLPEKKDLGTTARVLRNMVRAHAAAFDELKSGPHGTSARVGIAQHLRVFAPHRPWLPLDQLAARVPQLAFNHWFLRACTDGFAGFPLGLRERVPEAAGTMDYVGLNYYSRDMVAFDPRRPGSLFSHNFAKDGVELSDFQMEVYPAGIYALLVELWQKYGKPIYITENGVADAIDRLRPRALVAHLAETARAAVAGVDLRGYLHWSTMDNFEWSEGFSMRFGLVEVDYATQARTPRPSAALYSRIIGQGGLSWSDLQEYYPRALPYFVGAGDRVSESRRKTPA
jgi:beta-glucosidase